MGLADWVPGVEYPFGMTNDAHSQNFNRGQGLGCASAPRPASLNGLNDYGSTMSYDSSLAGIQAAADHGNIEQAESLIGQLTRIFQNDVAAGRVTDKYGLQTQFSNTAAYIQNVITSASANQDRWNAIVGQLQQNASILNSDVGYMGSEGNFASTRAAQKVDASQGGVANTVAGFKNVANTPSTWFSIPGAVGQAVSQGGVLDPCANLPRPLAWMCANPKATAGIVTGLIALAYAGPPVIKRARAWSEALS